MVDADGGFSLAAEPSATPTPCGPPHRPAHARRGAGRCGDQVAGRGDGGRTTHPTSARALADGPGRRRVPGCVLPILDEAAVVAPSTSTTPAASSPFFGGREEKWRSLRGALVHAQRRGAGPGHLRETLHDREAVTTVVTRIGAATSRGGAAHRAGHRADRVRLGVRLVLGAGRAGRDVLRFQQESGSAGEEFRAVTPERQLRRGRGPVRPRLAGAGPGVRPGHRRGDRLRARARRAAGRGQVRRLLPAHGERQA